MNRPRRRTTPVVSEADKATPKQKPVLPKLLIADDERHIAEGLQMLLVLALSPLLTGFFMF